MTKGVVRQYWEFVALGSRLSDWAIIVLARVAASFGYDGFWQNHDTILSVVAVVSFAFFAEANGLYRSWRGIPVRVELRTVLWTWVLTALTLLLWLYASKTGQETSRVGMFSWFIGVAVVLTVTRSVKNRALAFFRSQGRNTRTAGIVGATPLTLRLLKELSDPSHGIRVAGVYDSRQSSRVANYLGGVRFAGDLGDAVEAARRGELDFVYIALPLRAEARIAEAVAALADTTATVQLVTDFSSFDLLRARWASVGRLPTLAIFDTPFSGASAFIKRLEDLIVGGFLLLLASPVMIAVAIAIKVTTRGPVFFAQTRYGLGGKPIKVLKFRSMTTADDGNQVAQATRDDARITPIGAFLRSTSLDELPQLINVLKGDMSLVGPRPHAVAHNEQYRTIIHGYMLRHKVKPGITGWAQVNGLRGETDTVDKMRARVEYDLDYIENWDLRWDLEIIFRTALRVWTDRNAY